MSGLLARVRSFWRGLRRPGRLEAEMDEEMRFHVEMEAERLARERGLSPEEAHRQAAIAFGGRERYKEEGRDVRGLTGVSGMALDLKLGLRMLARNPGITLVGGAGLAVGIAISAGVFSVIGTMVDPALPVDEGERVVAIGNFDVASGADQDQTHLHDLGVWSEELTAVGELGAFRALGRNLVAEDGPPEPVRVAEMTASGFRIARVPPLLGRWLVEEDERAGSLPVVVIGHQLWRERFGARADVLGRTLRLGGEPHTVVGVMPEGFAFPVNNRLWVPLRLDPLAYERGTAPGINVFGRLARGATLEGARAQLGTIGRRMAAAYPATHEHVRPTLVPYTHSFVDSPQLLWVFRLVRLFVAVLLAVIAVNVAVLVYARTATRTGEIAVRMALGASRTRVVTQLFAEALVLSALAAVVGLVGAGSILQRVATLLGQFGGEQLPFWWRVRLTPGTVLYVAGLAVLAAAIIGVVPALKATGSQLQAMLRQLGGGTGMRLGGTWTVLIALQVAIAMALMPVAAALPLSRLATSSAESPVPLDEILTADVSLQREPPGASEAEAYERAHAARFVERRNELIRRLAMEPGVTAVVHASSAPSVDNYRPIELETPLPSAEAGTPIARTIDTGPGLFELFGARILAGRDFQPGEMAAASAAVVVTQGFVQAVLGGGDALGRRFRYAAEGDAAGEWYEIVGVVSDFPGGETPKDAATIYHPTSGASGGSGTILLRVQGAAPPGFAGRLREIASEVDPELSLTDPATMTAHLRMLRGPESMLESGILAVILSVLLLASAGIHALVSLTVSQRRKEIGIRIALGARPLQLLRGILARALRQIVIGLGVGGVLAAALIPAITTTGSRAALLVAAVSAIMLTVGGLAVVGPARRGLGVQPMEALRDE